MTLATSSLLTLVLVLLAIVTSPGLAAAQTVNSAQPGYDADSARVDEDYGGGVEPCPPGHFLSAGAMQGEGQTPQCQVCSTCPTNQIIRRICSARDDTLCGPFYEFHDFHQSPNHGDPSAHPSGSRSQKKQGSDDLAHDGRRLEPDMTSLDPTRDQWRHLTLILLTFLSVFCVVVVVFGVIICRLRKRQLREKQIVYEPGLLMYPDASSQDTDTILTSRDKSCYTFHAPVFSDNTEDRKPPQRGLGMHLPSSQDWAYVRVYGDVSQV